MRKYQQLLLVIISILSISVLLIYKSENNRLKYVLQVVNFFGRNEASVLSRLENGTQKQDLFNDFSNPLPVWQRITDDFYLYSAFWEELDNSPGGNAIAIVAGRQSAIINFKCSLRYKNGSDVRASFLFMPVNLQGNEKIKNMEDFSVFKFMCQITHDLNKQKESPSSLLLTEVKTGREQAVALREFQSRNGHHKISKTSMVVCLNLLPFIDQTMSEFLTKQGLMQFFVHHQINGIEDIIVYASDLIPLDVKRLLIKTGLRIHYFPFNFPFNYKTNKTRGIVEMDCLMRTSGFSKYVILLEPNEFFYPNLNIHLKDSIVSSLSHFADHINRFELATFSVCLDHKNKLFVDNNYYDSGNEIDHKIYISKSTLHPQNVQSVALPLSRSFAHHYINCVSRKDLLYDWRNSIREDFMQYIQTVRNELSFLF